jgi:Ca2+-dependent lipid-binding protein
MQNLEYNCLFDLINLKQIYLLMNKSILLMAVEGIANFDSYVWVAVGLFIIGLFAIMVYEKSNSKTQRHYRQQQQQQQQQSGTSSDIE